MRVQLLRFSGYSAGQTDFAASGAVIPGNPTFELDTALQTIAKGMTGVENVRSAITVVGHSDRQDRSDMTCDQRRQSEIDASRERAVSAWEWIKPVVAQYASEEGWSGGDWWEASDRVTWDLVFAAAGMLLTDSANEAERAQNRRVDILISIFRV
jgi:flagellar motor protein MotB